ncbi:MAG: hypothetical protein WC860_03025 [Candidatus Margulisiibacteriota bacterium]|jgi:hypothetical protein
MSIERTPGYQQRILQQMVQYHPEMANPHIKQEELKRRREEMRKKTEELEKIKKHHAINKTNKSKLGGVIGKIRPDQKNEIDHTI